VVALHARDAALNTAILLRRDDTSFLVPLSSSRTVSTLPFTSSALTWGFRESFEVESKMRENIASNSQDKTLFFKRNVPFDARIPFP
jgi:hypothetical protein